MPLLYIKNVAPDVKLALWHIAETSEEQDCNDLTDSLIKRVGECHSSKRRSEMIAVNSLLRVLLPQKEILLTHEKSGKPILVGYNVSISHTRGVAAVILSTEQKVAVDVEYYSERVNKIVHKFLREDEPFTTTEQRLLCWCAKETLYKLCSEQDLSFNEMCVKPFMLSNNGCFQIENLRTGDTYTIHYDCHEEYFLTYTCVPRVI